MENRLIDSMQHYRIKNEEVHKEAMELIKNKSKVLSCGCGPGREVSNLVRKECDVTAIDIQPDVLTESFKKEPGASYYLADMVSFNIDIKFDYIVCLWNTINQIGFKERKKFILNCYSLLKENGKLIITSQNATSSIRIFLKRTLQGRVQKKYYYKKNQIDKWFRNTKFSYNIKKKEGGHYLIVATK